MFLSKKIKIARHNRLRDRAIRKYQAYYDLIIKDLKSTHEKDKQTLTLNFEKERARQEKRIETMQRQYEIKLNETEKEKILQQEINFELSNLIQETQDKLNSLIMNHNQMIGIFQSTLDVKEFVKQVDKTREKIIVFQKRKGN